MKLITSNDALLNSLSRLLGTYPKVSFAVAWASANTAIFRQLVARTSRIERAVIGTHFYQTHPDVVDTFVTKNSEACLLVSQLDDHASSVEKQIASLIGAYWDKAVPVDKDSAVAYRSLWAASRPALKRLSGSYGKTKARKPPTGSSVMSMSWNSFLSVLKAGQPHEFKKRYDFLRSINNSFLENPDFASMDVEVRKAIAGLPNSYDTRWGCFGSMKGAGRFNTAIIDNDVHISRALDRIQRQGQVSRSQYDRYLAEFAKAFPNGGHGVATASRLLALKRPDQFVCLDSKNLRELCKDFGIRQTGMDYERYWSEVIERIMDSPWWNAPRPTDGIGGAVWDGRAAMLDSIFYRP